MQTFESIGKLLSAINEAGGIVPADFAFPDANMPLMERDAKGRIARDKRLALMRAINGAFSWHRLHYDVADTARAKDRAEALASIIKQSNRLIRLLRDEKLRLNFPMPTEDGNVSVLDALPALESIKAGAATEAKRVGDDGLAQTDPKADWAPKLGTADGDLFIRLAGIFEQHLRMDAKFKYLDRLPSNPWFVFLDNTLARAGQQKTPTAIAKAWERVREQYAVIRQSRKSFQLLSGGLCEQDGG